jgi:hypothetical protein
MIISYYGKKFLKKFNEVEGKNLTSKEFFIKHFYPLFYGEEKTLMFIQNSPFSNPANKKKSVDEKLQLFFEKIKNHEFDSSMFIGGFAADLTSTTSFNLPTDYNNVIDENEIFYSWIGQALSLQFKGINFLFDDETILYDIYLGWKRYRELLSNPLYVDYKGGQISTWNMLWLTNQYSSYSEKKFNPFEQNKDKLVSTSWVKLLFYIATKHFEKTINAYAYKFSQTNETYGIIPIELKKIEGFLNFCSQYFGKNEFLNSSALYEKIYGTGYSMEKICEFGSIGLLALKPDLLKLEEYQHKSVDVLKKINIYYKGLVENESIYKFYNIYLMATLNLKDIEKDVIEIANAIYTFDDATRTNNKMLIEELLATRNLSGFLNCINKMMEICTEEHLTAYADTLTKLMNLGLSDENKLSNLMLFISINYNKIKLENK